MTLTGENRSTRRKTCPSATLYVINLTRTGLGSNPALRGDRSGTDSLSHRTDLKTYAELNYIKISGSYRQVNILYLVYKNKSTDLYAAKAALIYMTQAKRKILLGQNVEILNVKIRGTQSNQQSSMN
jgi:hypothetical protein